MKSGENGLIGPGDNDYGRKETSYTPLTHIYTAGHKKKEAVSLMLQAARELELASARIIELENQTRWISVKDKLPALDKKVIKTDLRVKDHPEYDNQCIDYLTKDCNTGEIVWWNNGRKPSNQYWIVLPDPPIEEPNP